MAREDFIAQQPDLLRRLLRAHCRGAQDCVEHHEETQAVVQARMPDYSSRVLERVMTRTLPYWNVTGQVDNKGLAVAVDTTLSLGAIPRKLTPSELVDDSGLPA